MKSIGLATVAHIAQTDNLSQGDHKNCAINQSTKSMISKLDTGQRGICCAEREIVFETNEKFHG